IRELAEYERLSHAVLADEARVRETLFGEAPAAEVLLAFQAHEPVGFAVFFMNYSTFVGKRGMYLEDLYVRPAARQQGVGRALLRRVAKLAIERDCGRMEWAALDWNERAISFYKNLGAQPLDEW